MSDLTVRVETSGGGLAEKIFAQRAMLLEDFYLEKLRVSFPYLKHPLVTSLEPSDNLFLPAAGAGELWRIAKDQWKQPLSTFLDPPTNTVTFILKLPESAPIPAGPGVSVRVGRAISANPVFLDDAVIIAGKTLNAVVNRQYQLLYTAIKKGKVQRIDSTRHLKLACKGAFWFQASNDILFVREVYPCLFDLLGGGDDWSYTFKRHPQGVVLYGQPGIGKSVLGDYLLYRFLQMEWIVFVMPAATKDLGYLFMEGKVYEGNLSTLDLLCSCSSEGRFNGKRIVAILDSRIYDELSIPLIMISSPGPMRESENTDALNKFTQFQIPTMSPEEMIEMRRVAFSHLPEGDCEKRLELWGCIPRYVFVEIDEADQRSAVASLGMIKAKHISDAVRAATTGETAIRCHRIIQERNYGQTVEHVPITNAVYYAPGETAFLSEPLGAWAIDKFRVDNTWDLWNMVVNSGKVPDMATLRGDKFEDIVWSLLHTDRSYFIQQLGEAWEPAQHILSANEVRHFASVDLLFEMVASTTLKDLEGVLFVPAWRNLCDIDGILVLNGCPIFLQVTVGEEIFSEEHTLKGPGLAAAAAAFGWRGNDKMPWEPKQILLYYLVPEHRFESWENHMPFFLSDFVVSTKHDSVIPSMKGPRAARNTQRVQQFAVELTQDAVRDAFKTFAAGFKTPLTLLEEMFPSNKPSSERVSVSAEPPPPVSGRKRKRG